MIDDYRATADKFASRQAPPRCVSQAWDLDDADLYVLITAEAEGCLEESDRKGLRAKVGDDSRLAWLIEQERQAKSIKRSTVRPIALTMAAWLKSIGCSQDLMFQLPLPYAQFWRGQLYQAGWLSADPA